MKPNAIVIHERDNVAVVIAPCEGGAAIRLTDRELTAREAIPAFHKVALFPIARGESVIRYGEVIGVAATAIAPGQWVHTHNLGSAEE